MWEKPPAALLEAAPDAAPTTDDLPEAGSRGYDVLDYDLDLAIDVGARRVRGVVAITLRAAGGDLDTTRLDLYPELAVDSLLWNGVPSPFRREGRGCWPPCRHRWPTAPPGSCASSTAARRRRGCHRSTRG